MAIIGLVSLGLLVALTMLYLSKSIEKKPKFMENAVAAITKNLQTVSFFGMIFAIIAAMLYVLLAGNYTAMFVGLFANVLIVMMTAPYAFEQVVGRFRDKVNVAIYAEMQGLVARVTEKEKIFGYAGAVMSIILFAVIFQ